MRFMLMVYLDEEAAAKTSSTQRDETLKRCFAHRNEGKHRGMTVAAAVLHPVALSTTVRVRDGRTILADGPFEETREQLGGYCIVDCANAEQALGYAAEAVDTSPGRPAAIEVRPIRDSPAA